MNLAGRAVITQTTHATHRLSGTHTRGGKGLEQSGSLLAASSSLTVSAVVSVPASASNGLAPLEAFLSTASPPAALARPPRALKTSERQSAAASRCPFVVARRQSHLRCLPIRPPPAVLAARPSRTLTHYLTTRAPHYYHLLPTSPPPTSLTHSLPAIAPSILVVRSQKHPSPPSFFRILRAPGFPFAFAAAYCHL